MDYVLEIHVNIIEVNKMNFKIMNNDDESIKVLVEFTVSDWSELEYVMGEIDNMEL